MSAAVLEPDALATDRPLRPLPLPTISVSLSPADAFVFSRVDGVLTADQIVEITPLSAEAVKESLRRLLDAGMIEVAPASPDRTQQQEVEKALARIKGKGHYEVLEVLRDADAEALKAAYFRLVKQFHPDRYRGSSDDAKNAARTIFLRASEAYNVLRFPASREAYDTSLGSGPKAPTRSPMPEPTAMAPVPLRPVDDLLQEAEAQAGAGRLAEAAYILETLLPRTGGQLRQQASLRLASAQGSLPDGARKAEATLKAVVEEDPTCAEAWFALGALYKRGGMHARAAALFRKVLAIEPRHEMAERELREFEGNSEPEPTKGRLIGRLFGSRR